MNLGDLFIKTLDNLGILNLFFILFLFSIFFLTSYIILRSIGKISDEKLAKFLSAIISISIAFLLVSVEGLRLFFQYFLSFSLGIVLIIFLFLVSLSLLLGENISNLFRFYETTTQTGAKVLSLSTGGKISVILIIIFLIIFAILSFYYAYEDQLLSMQNPNTPQGIQTLFMISPQIIIIPIFFSILGIFIILFGR